MAQELAGKVAIITGAANGLGRAMAELFVAEGASVVVADIDGHGEDLVATLGKSALFKQTDVSKPEQVQALIDFAVTRFGGLHVICNNAGLSGTMVARFLEDELKDFQQVIGVNLLGVMLGSQRAARHMAAHGGGSIINIASVAGQLPGMGVMTYRASKAGVIHFSKSIAIDLAANGIRVNCIAPGSIRTQMNSYTDPNMSAEVAERIRATLEPVMMSNQPLKRRGTPADVAQAALYLASDRSAQVTGMVLPVDGGIAAGDPVNHLEEIMAARALALRAD